MTIKDIYFYIAFTEGSKPWVELFITKELWEGVKDGFITVIRIPNLGISSALASEVLQVQGEPGREEKVWWPLNTGPDHPLHELLAEQT